MKRKVEDQETSDPKKSKEETEETKEREDEPKKGLSIVSFNVAGISACVKKGFCESMIKLDADIICLQEIKTSLKKPPPSEISTKMKKWKYKEYNMAEKPGYAGTAILSKIKPIKFTKGMGKSKHDTNGRVVTAEFEKFYLVTTYVPNSGRGLVNLEYRTKEWEVDFRAYLTKLGLIKPVILCGDMNVAHKPIDLKNDKSNYNKSAGYTQAEIDELDKLIASGFVDSYRELYPEKEEYTFWSYMGNSRAKNVGWRLDYFLLQGESQKWLVDNIVHGDITGSDHCPVELKLNISL